VSTGESVPIEGNETAAPFGGWKSRGVPKDAARQEEEPDAGPASATIGEKIGEGRARWPALLASLEDHLIAEALCAPVLSATGKHQLPTFVTQKIQLRLEARVRDNFHPVFPSLVPAGGEPEQIHQQVSANETDEQDQ